MIDVIKHTFLLVDTYGFHQLYNHIKMSIVMGLRYECSPVRLPYILQGGLEDAFNFDLFPNKFQNPARFMEILLESWNSWKVFL